jgi:hypothetical protein
MDEKKLLNFNVLVNSSNGMPGNIFVSTDFNLLEAYKSALLSNNGFVTWEKGVINVNQIVGIIDTTY